MAGKKKIDKEAAPLVVLFVEGDTDQVFFNALLQYYRGVSSTPVNAAQVVNLQSVTRYASKMMSTLQNDIMPSAKQKGREIKAVCCSYDTDVFEAGVQVVDWAQVEKKVRKLGIDGFCRVGVQSMIEDWSLDDVAGLCSFLKLKQVPTALAGRSGYEKLVWLFAKVGMKYSKGMSVASFLGSLDMGVIRGKRKAVLKGLEEALGVRIEETRKK